MRKWIVLLIALVLCTGLTCGALADCTLTELRTLEDADWISDSCLLRVPEKDGYHVYDIDGRALTEDAYTSGLSYKYGYVTGSLANDDLNACGLFDTAGQVIMPYQYADIKVLSRDWALGFVLVEATADNYDYTSWGSNSSYYLIDTVDVYNLSKGVKAGTFPRANFKDADVVNNVINIEDRASGVVTCYDADFNALGTVDYTWDDTYAAAELAKFRENGQYGLKDAEGNVVMPASFYTIYDFYGDYAAVSTGEKEGLIDRQGNVVIPAEYDDIKRGYYGPYDPATDTDSYNAAGYFAVVKDDKLGFVDAQGNVTCEPKYSEKIMELYGASATYTDMEGITHILSADGVDFTVNGYEKLYCLDGSAGLLFRVNDADYNYGVIDWHGSVVLDCVYDSVDLSGDGRYLLARTDYKSPYTLYQVDYAAAQPAQTAQAAEPAQTAEAELDSETPAFVEPTPSAQAASSDAKALVSSIVTLLEADASANKLTITTLLDSMLTLTEDASAQAIITSARTLIETDAAANASAVVTLLRSVEALL